MANHTGDPGDDRGLLPEWFSPEAFSQGLLDAITFAAILLVAYAVGRLGRTVYERSIHKVPSSGQLLFGKIMVLIAATTGFFMALSLVYTVRPLNLLATLGVVSLALGFGLQNTVANLAAGVGLTMDKPFDVGDRIRIGETWGDVVTIGLRSTRIVTVNGDLVVVPNSILDTRELWNYTYQENQKFRLDVPVGISYRSSIPLAEAIMLRIARSHPQVLAYPEPCVRAVRFGESSVDLELRAWISAAQNRAAVRDGIIRAIKERFDEEGVAIPFPQRTVSYLRQLPEPAPTPDFHKGEAGAKPVVLVCTRGRESAQELAGPVTEFVKAIDARMVVLHVRKPSLAMNPYEGQAALNVYLAKAQRAHVAARAESEVGELSAVLPRVVRESDARMVIFGRPRHRRLGAAWVRSEVGEAKSASPVPVVVVDPDDAFPAETVAKWRDHLHPPEPRPVEERPTEAAKEEDGSAS